MISFCPPRSLLLLCLGLLGLGLGDTAPAQPAPPVEQFDLVLVGDRLNPEVHRISLKTNPTQGEMWTPAVTADRSPRCTSTESLLVVPDLPAEQYVGQDIRENHLSLKITTQDPETEGTLRAVYAVPSIDPPGENACTRLARLIRTDPATIRRHSLASYVRPQPASLEADAPFIDHVEAPVRHLKPGVMEVEWLEILMGEGN